MLDFFKNNVEFKYLKFIKHENSYNRSLYVVILREKIVPEM